MHKRVIPLVRITQVLTLKKGDVRNCITIQEVIFNYLKFDNLLFQNYKLNEEA